MFRRVVGAGVAALTFACVFSLVAINERASRSPATVLAQAGHKYVALPSFSDKQGTNRAFLAKADGSGQSTKGRVQMLASISGSGAARRAAKHAKYVALPQAGGFGTDMAFLSKGDGSGQSTKAQTQMLASILGSGAKRRQADAQRSHQGVAAGYVRLPDVGSMGTNQAFVNKGDGKGMGHTSKLSGFGTDKAFLNKADGSGQSTKGRKQQLYEWTADMEGTYLPAADEYTGAGTKMIQISQNFNPTSMMVTENNLGGIPGEQPANVLPFASTYVIGH